GELMADIDIDSMYVNEFAVAPLCLLSAWDLSQQRVRVRVKNQRTNENIVTGYYDPTSVRYYAEGTFEKMPMASLGPVMQGILSSTEGEASAKLEIAGQRRQAKLNGSVNVYDLATTVDFTQARYSAPRATLQVKDNHFIANNVRVYDKEGNSGMFNMDLSLEHLSNIAYSVRVVPRNMIVLDTDISDNDLFYGKVYGSGVATITGDKKGTTLDIVGSTEGDSQFFMPLSSKSDAANADFVVFEQSGVREVADSSNYLSRRKLAFERRNRQRASAGTGALNINVELTAKPNTEVQLVIDPTVGDIIKARGEGELNMRIVPNANIFEMYGDYTITDGSYLFTLQNIINKKFLIESGSTIQWTGDPLDARLNIDAVYKLKASLQPLLSSTTLENIKRAVPVECIINLTDRLTAPTVLFDIKVPNADSDIQNAVANLLNNQQSIATQFMYLLVSGAFYSDSSTSASIGATASATTGFELLSNQLSNWLSSDDYNIILRYRPRSELTSDEIDFGFSKSLVNDRLLVELEGNYLVDNRMAASSNLSNFMGEAYITWLIDQNGNLKLKGFTQTIDRFDENQGLQETGVGIYYKEDFNNWADLKRRMKERFMSRRKREERQQQEREAEEERLRQSDSLLRSGENAAMNRFIETREDSDANQSGER
ncbi:MAG: translocation/assembly module TamB domain-containing protein, partial [Alistipes sp.]|nr:translocation/assembly module TamB domain-containing protein [Alistipes sp.]